LAPLTHAGRIVSVKTPAALSEIHKIFLKYLNTSRYGEGGGVPPEKNTSCLTRAVKNASVMNTSEEYAVVSCGEAGNVPRNIGRETGREDNVCKTKQRMEHQNGSYRSKREGANWIQPTLRTTTGGSAGADISRLV